MLLRRIAIHVIYHKQRDTTHTVKYDELPATKGKAYGVDVNPTKGIHTLQGMMLGPLQDTSWRENGRPEWWDVLISKDCCHIHFTFGTYVHIWMLTLSPFRVVDYRHWCEIIQIFCWLLYISVVWITPPPAHLLDSVLAGLWYVLTRQVHVRMCMYVWVTYSHTYNSIW